METITIDAKDTIDWVLQRRKLKQNWSQKLKALETKTKEILDLLIKKEIPELNQVFSEIEKDGFDFAKLMELETEIYKSKEAEERTFFGGYKSKSVKDVRAVVKIYKKEFLGFANLAQILSRIIVYDIPHCKRVVKNNLHVIKDLRYKISTYQSSMLNTEKDVKTLIVSYNPATELNEIDLARFQVQSFINDFVSSLPKRVAVIEEKMKAFDLELVLKYYKEFSLYTSEEEVEEKYFASLETLKQYGDCLLENYQNGVLHTLTEKERLAMYKKLFAKKGFSNDLSCLDDEDDLWEIEDLTDNQEGETEKTVKTTTKTRSDCLDTLLTNRDSRENIIELLNEVS